MALVDRSTAYKYEPLLRALCDENPLDSATTRAKLSLLHAGDVEVLYAPMNFANENAHVLIVGITPGKVQASIALRECSRSLNAGKSLEDACGDAKYAASFAGPMRVNLIRMLDDLGVPEALNLRTSAELFASRRDLLDTGSVLPYPVFLKGNNYTGHNPKCDSSAAFWRYTSVFAERLNLRSGSLIVPLGETASDVIRTIAGEVEHCLFGFPHPSGANGHRQDHFAQRFEELRRQVEHWSR
jgi:hypothetical protein